MKNQLSISMGVVQQDHELCAGFARAPYFPFVVKKGQGAILEDIEGKQYIDLLSSAAAINTGHCHPKVVAALTEQIQELIHYTPGYVYHGLRVEVAQELINITPGTFRKKVAYGLSGSDAIDGMIKVVRAYTGRPKLVSFVQAYHGSTYGALSLSALNLNMRRRIGPLLPEVHHINYPDCFRCSFGEKSETCDLQCLNDFKLAMTHYLPAEEIAALVMEPIAGDAGLLVPPKRYVQELHSICQKYGVLFVVDEVQQGFGRTGKWFSIEHFDVDPDIIVMGKSIASGIPMSAIVGRAEIMDAIGAPGHVFTTGGSPVACRGALATIQVLKEENLLQHAHEMGEYIRSEFSRMAKTYELIGDVRGLGLTIGVDLVTDRVTKEKAREAAAKVCYRTFENGVIMIFLAGNVLRIQPPLVISKEQIDQSLAVVEQSIKDYLDNKIPDEVLKFAKGW